MTDISQTIAQLRHEYTAQPFDADKAAADPLKQFRAWFDASVQTEQPDPEAMTLSTATVDGRVSARVVLLKGLDERGFVFFTNYESRKSRELLSNPHAALTFYWHALHRQVRIEGAVEQVTPDESEEYFQTRPRGSQLGAWASPQSAEIESRAALEQRLAEVEERFKTEPLHCPPFWGGFRVKPTRIEFWQGRESRLHDRIVYTRQHGAWRIARLAP